MSYQQAMKWRRKHPKGTKQPVIMSTNSGFWPSSSWLEGSYYPYATACEALGVEPWPCQKLYDLEVAEGILRATPEEYAKRTKEST